MDTLTKVAAWVGLLLAGTIAALVLFSPSSASVGSTSTGHQEIFAWGFGGGLQIGRPSVAPVIKSFVPGTCSLIAPSFSVSASTTVSMDCAVSSATKTDLALGWFATSSPSTAGPGWEITRTSASSTAGYLTFSITNGTGATATIPASLASSTQYLDIGL